MTGHLYDGGGRIEIVTGCVFSGKTEELIRRVKQAELAHLKTQAFRVDPTRHRDSPDIVSHSGLSIPATVVTCVAEIESSLKPDLQVVAVDEAQFLEQQAVQFSVGLADRGIRVILDGLDMDFRCQPFGSLAALLAVAEIIEKRHAVCVVCGKPATRSQRLLNGLPAFYSASIIVQGHPVSYEPRCRACHKVS